MTSGPRIRATAAVITAALACAAAPAAADHNTVDMLSPAGDEPFHWLVMSVASDGARSVVVTDQQASLGDTDTALDLYRPVVGGYELLTPGASGSVVSFVDASDDARHVLFTSTGQFSPADTDNSPDFYLSSDGVVALISGGSADVAPGFAKLSEDGSGVVFTTEESLVPADTDTRVDAYHWSNGQLALASPGGTGTQDVFAPDISDDGDLVALETTDQLTNTDTDNAFDVYLWSGGQPGLISGPSQNNQPVFYSGASDDLGTVFLETFQQLVAGDTDFTQDVYRYSLGNLTVATPDTTLDAEHRGNSTDGAVLVYETYEQVLPADQDGGSDIYRSSAGNTELISVGGTGDVDVRWGSLSDDAGVAAFQTEESLLPEDQDGGRRDVYRFAGGSLALASSGGQGPFAADFVDVAPSGARLFFLTEEALAGADADGGQFDVYEFSANGTSLVSAGGNDAHFVSLLGDPAMTDDGSQVGLVTQGALSSADTDGTFLDAYLARIAPPGSDDDDPADTGGNTPGGGTGQSSGSGSNATIDLTFSQGPGVAPIGRARLLRGGLLRVAMRNRNPFAVDALVVLRRTGAAGSRRDRRIVGTARVRLDATSSRAIRIRLTRAAYRTLLRGRGRQALRMTVTVRDRADRTAVARRTIRVSPAGR